MSVGRFTAAAMGRALCVAATSGAAVIVPVLYAPTLEAPFYLPKEVAFELAAAVSLLGFALQFGLRARGDGSTRDPDSAVAPAAPERARGRVFWRAIGAPSVALGAGLLLAAMLLSAARARLWGPVGAPYALESAMRWASLFALACGATVIGRAPATRLGLFQSVTLSAGLVSAIGLWQHLELHPLPIPVISSPGSTFGNRNMGGEAIAVSLPFGLAALSLARARGERWLMATAVALACLYLAATRARGAWLGAAVGISAFLFMNRRRWSRRAIAGAAAIAAIALVIAILPGRSNPRYAADTKRLANGLEVIENSFNTGAPALRTRLGLWRRSLAMFATAPVAGVGPGNWSVVFPSFAEPGATAEGVQSPGLAPRHAHNDLLELVTETGLLGLAAILILAASVIGVARRNSQGADVAGRIATSAAAASLLALVGAGLTGFPLEMPATLALGGLSLGLLASRALAAVEPSKPMSAPTPMPAPAARPWQRFAAICFALGLVGLTALVGARRLSSSAWLGTAERALRGDPGPAGATRARVALDRAAHAEPRSFRVALRMAHVAARLHLTEQATRAAERALATEPFSPNAWATLAGIELDGGDPHSARASADRALALLADYPFALFVRARAAQAAGDPGLAEASWAHLEKLARAAPPVDPDLAKSARELLRARHVQ